MLKINIRNRCDFQGGEFICRGRSPLGNPFIMKAESDRDRVCDKYKTWLWQQIKEENKKVINELNRLLKLAQEDELNLVCFCVPKRCHGDTIKACLIWMDSK